MAPFHQCPRKYKLPADCRALQLHMSLLDPRETTTLFFAAQDSIFGKNESKQLQTEE